ncbi:class I SAM-dependent methyltransferase [Pseudonocardia humida]|uniref:class I SAM-dependent methyltransferase n=1 Tax=Pseudonocardia humida TaxID=2800819 RepID=UPI00355762E0
MSAPKPERPRPGKRRTSAANVSESFDEHAATYDRMVGANPGYHEHLRLSARRMGIPNRGSGMHLLDLGCGTGASTEALLAAAPDARITAVDASKEMLAQAAAKTWPPTVRFVHADAEDLVGAGITGPFDGVLAAYLVRNLTDRDATLRAVQEIMRPGAPLALHEYSVKDSPRSRAVWTAVCWTVIIPMGRLRAGSGELYRYLWRSVLDFDGVRGLTERMRGAGFEDIKVQTVAGWQQDIVHTFLGRKPGGTDVVDPALTVAPTPPEGIDVTKPE